MEAIQHANVDVIYACETFPLAVDQARLLVHKLDEGGAGRLVYVCEEKAAFSTK